MVRKTNEQKEWIIKNKDNFPTYAELTDAFNKMFGTNVKMGSVYNFLRCRGFIDIQNESYQLSDYEIDFLRSNIKIMPFTKLTKAFNEEFKKNYNIRRIQHICFNNRIYRGGKNLPVGTEREICNGKYILVKVKADGDSFGEKWKLKQRAVWEENYGEITDGKVVFFLDGNTHNFDIKNLYLTDKRTVYLIRNSGWITSDVELNLVILKWCELYYALK